MTQPTERNEASAEQQPEAPREQPPVRTLVNVVEERGQEIERLKEALHIVAVIVCGQPDGDTYSWDGHEAWNGRKLELDSIDLIVVADTVNEVLKDD